MCVRERINKNIKLLSENAKRGLARILLKIFDSLFEVQVGHVEKEEHRRLIKEISFFFYLNNFSF